MLFMLFISFTWCWQQVLIARNVLFIQILQPSFFFFDLGTHSDCSITSLVKFTVYVKDYAYTVLLLWCLQYSLAPKGGWGCEGARKCILLKTLQRLKDEFLKVTYGKSLKLTTYSYHYNINYNNTLYINLKYRVFRMLRGILPLPPTSPSFTASERKYGKIVITKV